MGELHRRRSWPVGFTTETSFDNFQSCCASWAALLRHFCLDMGDPDDGARRTGARRQGLWPLTAPIAIIGTHGGHTFCVQGSRSMPPPPLADTTPLWVG